MSNVSDEDPREVVRRMLYEENGPVEFKLYSAVSVFGDITIIMLVVCVCVCVCVCAVRVKFAPLRAPFLS